MSSDIPDVPPASFEQFERAVVAARTGDESAVAVLFVELQPRLLRFLRSQESRAADDLAADVWLSVAGSINGFDGGWDDFRAWFFTIARRRLIDHRRAGSRRQTDLVDARVLELRPASDEPEQQVLDAMSGQQAASLITSVLSGDQAQVLLLRVLGDLDTDQVALVMQRSTTWVRVTQHRALRRLADRLGRKVLVTR